MNFLWPESPSSTASVCHDQSIPRRFPGFEPARGVSRNEPFPRGRANGWTEAGSLSIHPLRPSVTAQPGQCLFCRKRLISQASRGGETSSLLAENRQHIGLSGAPAEGATGFRGHLDRRGHRVFPGSANLHRRHGPGTGGSDRGHMFHHAGDDGVNTGIADGDVLRGTAAGEGVHWQRGEGQYRENRNRPPRRRADHAQTVGETLEGRTCRCN